MLANQITLFVISLIVIITVRNILITNEDAYISVFFKELINTYKRLFKTIKKYRENKKDKEV